MASSNFNTENSNLRKLLGNGIRYVVPRFQRDYSWEVEQWEDLWADILEVVGGVDPQTEAEMALDQDHYMGYLVLQSRSRQQYDVIDGQQRLTTLSILVLAVMAHLQQLIDQLIEPENNRIRLEQMRNGYIGFLNPVTLVPQSKLELNRNNNHLYQNYLVPLRPIPQRGLTVSEHLMRKAYKWFFDRIGEHFNKKQTGEALASLVQELSDRLFFTVIYVDNELNAYKVFETLNARGVKLSSTDLLKNYLFSVIFKHGDSESAFQSLEERWTKLTESVGNDSFPNFLRAHWNSRHKLVRHQELFKRIRERVNDEGAAFALLRNMEDDLNVYVALGKPEDELWNNAEREYLSELVMFRVKQPFPLLMAAYHRFFNNDRASFTLLLKVISVMSFRYNVIGNLSPNEQERFYCQAAQLLAYGDITSIGQVLNTIRPLYVNDDVFRADFAQKVLPTRDSRNRKIASYLLAKLEKQQGGQAIDWDAKSYNLEHILPEKPDESWPALTEREFQDYRYRLGNFTLMHPTANRDIANHSFKVKSAAYAQDPLRITQQIALYNEWGTAQINARQQKMADHATAIWRISQYD